MEAPADGRGVKIVDELVDPLAESRVALLHAVLGAGLCGIAEEHLGKLQLFTAESIERDQLDDVIRSRREEAGGGRLDDADVVVHSEADELRRDRALLALGDNSRHERRDTLRLDVLGDDGGAAGGIREQRCPTHQHEDPGQHRDGHQQQFEVEERGCPGRRRARHEGAPVESD